MLKNDGWIARRCNYLIGRYSNVPHFTNVEDFSNEAPMIAPFNAEQVRKNAEGERILSYGLSSYGYDVRLANEIRMFKNSGAPLCPKSVTEDDFDTFIVPDGQPFVIPAGGFILGHTVEYFRIPREILVIAVGKSTYARMGLVVNVTPLEPEWEGQVVLEISNTTNRPMMVYPGEGVAQFLFCTGEEECLISYRDRAGGAGGKYQGQTGVTIATT